MQLASDAKDKYCICFIFDDHQPPFLGKQHLKMTASDFATFKQLQTSIFCNAFLGDPNNAAKFQFLMQTKLLNSVFFQFKYKGKFQFSVHFT